MSLRTWLVRRAMGRLRIDEDIVRHLSTFQRLGETLEVQSPGDMLPVGARTVFRAVRTRAAAQIGSGWVWPWWLERQLDPTSPAFVPRGHLPFLTNVTARNWTAIGNLDSPWEAVVDPRGLVTPWFDGWSLDWWVGADDRWHLPSREAATGVSQKLLDGMPVVETSMRVPGGHAVHRAWCVRHADTELVLVEVENRSRLPFAVAFAVRPANSEGLAVVERIVGHDRVVTVDGRAALLLPRLPSRAAASTFHRGDSADLVVAGDAPTGSPAEVRCQAGLAQAAFVYPLAHTARIRVAIPLVPGHRSHRARAARRHAADLDRAVDVPALPAAERVASGWRRHVERGMRVELPDARLAEAVRANVAALLVLHDGDDITPGPATYHRFWFRDAAYMLAALDRWGHHDVTRQVLASYPGRQRVDGFFLSQRDEWDSNGCALWALAEHWRLTRDRSLVEPMAGPIAKGAHWIDRKRRRARGRRSDEALAGLLPPGISAERLGPYDHFYWDDFWGIAGQLAAAELLDAVDQPDAAAECRRLAVEFRAAVDRSLDVVAKRLGTSLLPAGPRRRIDPALIGSLVACEPLRLLDHDDPRMAATVDVVRERFCGLGGVPAFYQGISHTGFGTYLTLQLAAVELAAGDRRALERFHWLLDAATPTWTWPEAIHPGTGGGCMGDGHHGWAAADVLSFVRSLLVREVSEHELALATLWPDDWLGHGVEVHDAPTWFGQLSYAVRWHGARPALLWELEPHADRTTPVRLTAPGLDPAWSTDEPKGEALLAPLEPPGGLPAVVAPMRGERTPVDEAPDDGVSFD
ncbi:MAG: hypothetical protein ACRD0G_10800 [Acidimicrobiales bacterium]